MTMSLFNNNCHDISNLYADLDRCNKDGRFWSVRYALTFNKPFIIITASRSVGKSTSIAVFLLLDFIVNGYKFIYLRRTRDEVLETCKDYFSNAIKIINDNLDKKIEKVEYRAGEYYIKMQDSEKESHCGYAIGLSLESKYKSKPFDNVGTIIYDEFLPKDKNKYLGSVDREPDKEPRLFNSLYASVDREVGTAFKSSTRVILSGNTETIYNPFFIAWGVTSYIYKDGKAKVVNPKNKPWVLERVTGVNATADYEKSLLYAMSNDSDKGYNFNNNGGKDFDNAWLEKPPRRSEHLLFARLDNKVYHFLRNKSDFYIARFTGEPYDRIISLDFSSFAKQDFSLVKRWNGNVNLMLIHDAFLRGALFFDTGQTRNIFTNYFNLI